jgi:hypothetical protein
MGDNITDGRFRNQAKIGGTGNRVFSPGIVFIAGGVQVDFLRAKAQRHAPTGENNLFHAQDATVEIARFPDIRDRQHHVVDPVNLNRSRHF